MLRKTLQTQTKRSTWESLPACLMDRADRHPDRLALTFLDDQGDQTVLTYRQLADLSSSLAGEIRQSSQPGDRGLLLFPPGLDFLVGFLACQTARVVPVPTCFPKPGRVMPRLDAAALDCEPTVMLGDRATLDGLDRSRLHPAVNRATWIATDDDRAGSAAVHEPAFLAQIRPSDLGLLQYTSGSTSQPKGVMVSHANLMCNLEAIRQAFCIEFADDAADDDGDITRGVFWLPPFHDMGLIGGLLEAMYVGGHTVLMSPRSFLHRPMRWLETISQTKASISGAPNFAYQLCVDRLSSDQVASLDLSNWDLAFCGAEPIIAETLEQFAAKFSAAGFRSSSYCPCYGLAESTLLAAGGMGDSGPPLLHVDRDDLAAGRVTILDASDLGGAAGNRADGIANNIADGSQLRRLVSCGEPALGMTVRIVDGASHRESGERQIGEIWLQGSSVTRGYWRRDDENPAFFDARLADAPEKGGHCRTGDLGFLNDGRLFVTGRVKDVIILRGRNHYPQDIETTVRRAAGDDVVQCVALAGVQPCQRGDGESDTLTIVAEVSRHLAVSEMPELVRQIRRAVIDDHEVDARQVVLTRPASIPLTTSGKVQRQACRAKLAADELPVKHAWSRRILSEENGATTLPDLPTHVDRFSIEPAAEQIEAWLLGWLVLQGGVDQDQVHRETPFAEYGLDSLAAVELSGELEDWLGLQLTPVLSWNYPTPARLARYLAISLAGETEESLRFQPDSASDAELEALLSEIENLSGDELR